MLSAVLAGTAACTAARPEQANPELAQHGRTMTTVKPSHQDLSNKVSLAGKVALSPVFGVVAPIDGQVRYLDVKPPDSTPTKPTKIANIWAGGKATSVEIPAGTTFSGRLVDDKSTVTAGMPIASAKHVGYGIVADVDGAQAYRVSGAIATAQAQIKDGPGPFPCAVLGPIAALPAGTIPDPPPPADPGTGTGTGTQPGQQPGQQGQQPPVKLPQTPGKDNGTKPSDPTGLRLVCTAPDDVKMINGATVTLEVVTETATNVLVVPVEAVAGSAGKGKVDVVGADGARQTKDVTLGLTDGKVVEIKTGLTGDESIAVPGPNLPAAPPGADGKPGSK
ncbi:efflux RND transporter periplasmic adaptor subunit [Solihabitans fulvus]|uniref:efflux RND transporter periplasmic adaptor subunit n=1 Tax=Solihabitans fulvus TaxID=1892852 RepID=UPI001CB766F1|nr:efflux RND transporter periplasmic adaptor subunit [Solihabitans fulvus]